jgi:hypothetical protein
MKYALVAAIVALVASPAIAQSQSGRMTGTSPSAGGGVSAMTESQVRSDIEGAGYSGVSSLKKNTDGSWSAKATKSGASHDVMVGADGKVVER